MRCPCSTAIAIFLVPVSLLAQEYTVETVEEAAPSDALAAEIAAELSPTAIAIKKGDAVQCQIWLSKQWPVAEGFKATGEILYPFSQGQLIGAVKYARRGGDYRDQRIDRGVYTLRYAHQPVDGNHVGTSKTRDFLLLVKADEDKSPDAFDVKKLHEASAGAVGSSHPALLAMHAVEGEAGDKPSIRHDQQHDLWLVRLPGNAKAGGKESRLAFDLVIVGHAAE
jgi:hypothetical protein